MAEQALNYCTQAIESLGNQIKYFDGHSPMTASNIRRVIKLLQEAIKFFVPDNGRLFDDSLRSLPATFRLPYPVIAAEFRVTQDAPQSHQPLATAIEGILPSSKRIALAVEINEKNIDRFNWLIHSSQTYLLGDDGAIAIISVYFNDEEQSWRLPPFGLLTPCRKTDPNPLAASKAKALYGGEIPKGMTLLPLEGHLVFLLPEDCTYIQNAKGVNHTYAMMAQDTNDEFMAIMELVEILSCKNVSTGTIEAPKALNKKREAKGKPALYEYKVLMLEPQADGASSSSSSKGTHASPRVHLRRGHIRRLPDRNIWVNATVVGNKQMGMVSKDYAVRTAGSG